MKETFLTIFSLGMIGVITIVVLSSCCSSPKEETLRTFILEDGSKVSCKGVYFDSPGLILTGCTNGMKYRYLKNVAEFERVK